ncbi:MAG: glutamate--tRNA ligase family protein, partial [bacterium]
MNIVRFAPSPTGNVHIGNIRTAIFDWLFARNTKGKFLLRIEDTDKERSTKEAIDKLLECMEWLGIDYDDEIFYQSSQEEAHRDAAKCMLEEKKAYYPNMENPDLPKPIIFKIPWNSESCPNVRIVGKVELNICLDKPVEIAQGGVKFSSLNEKGKVVESFSALAGYRKLKLFGADDALIFEIENHVDAVLKDNKNFTFNDCKKITYERREVFYNDMIKGELSKPLDSMKDFVVLRSDGTPVFHLANVCDDITQKITHIIRGDDHVENTYKHIFLFEALHYPIPKYAHMPMIVNQSGKPYSKRDGDAFVGDFKEKGYLPDALFNYLSLLGWSPGDNREKMSRKEMIEAFSLDRVKSAPAQFDIVKLQNMNG